MHRYYTIHIYACVKILTRRIKDKSQVLSIALPICTAKQYCSVLYRMVTDSAVTGTIDLTIVYNVDIKNTSIVRQILSILLSRCLVIYRLKYKLKKNTLIYAGKLLGSLTTWTCRSTVISTVVSFIRITATRAVK